MALACGERFPCLLWSHVYQGNSVWLTSPCVCLCSVLDMLKDVFGRDRHNAHRDDMDGGA